jgi:hypothetical protein
MKDCSCYFCNWHAPLCKAVLVIGAETYACWEREGHAGMHRAPKRGGRVEHRGDGTDARRVASRPRALD